MRKGGKAPPCWGVFLDLLYLILQSQEAKWTFREGRKGKQEGNTEGTQSWPHHQMDIDKSQSPVGLYFHSKEACLLPLKECHILLRMNLNTCLKGYASHVEPLVRNVRELRKSWSEVPGADNPCLSQNFQCIQHIKLPSLPCGTGGDPVREMCFNCRGLNTLLRQY